MKAPDKICIGISPSKVGEGLVYTTVSKEYPYAKEYIRKDTLLEWVKEKANDYKGTANIRRSFEMMIRKIELL